jgi:acyl carrier protein
VSSATGALLLDELLDPRELEHFILFSSIAGVWGSGDHAAYAAANAFLDAFAEHRARVRGYPTLSVAWGVWASLAPQTDPTRLRRQGLVPLDAAGAFAALDDLVARGAPFGAIAEVDWAAFAPVFASARPRPLIAELEAAAAGGAGPFEREGGEAARSELAERLVRLPADDQLRALRELVGRELAAALKHDAPIIALERPFRELGLDSLTAVELRNRLARITGRALPATLAFDHPNVSALVSYLHAELIGGPPSVFEALDQVEAGIAQLARDHADRAILRERLAALAALLGAPAPVTGGNRDEDLVAASDDEVFDLIDRELER